MLAICAENDLHALNWLANLILLEKLDRCAGRHSVWAPTVSNSAIPYQDVFHATGILACACELLRLPQVSMPTRCTAHLLMGLACTIVAPRILFTRQHESDCSFSFRKQLILAILDPLLCVRASSHLVLAVKHPGPDACLRDKLVTQTQLKTWYVFECGFAFMWYSGEQVLLVSRSDEHGTQQPRSWTALSSHRIKSRDSFCNSLKTMKGLYLRRMATWKCGML